MSGFSATIDDVTSRLDHIGRPAWIALMVLGFILFWPLGLGLLFYIIWSGRMRCGAYARHGAWNNEGGYGDQSSRWERKMARYQEKMNRAQEAMARWSGGPSRGFRPTGNRAFDEYRDQMLQRLENEAQDFQDFLARLRAARDKQEFDQYMADRQARPQNPPQGQEPPQQPQPPQAG